MFINLFRKNKANPSKSKSNISFYIGSLIISFMLSSWSSQHLNFNFSPIFQPWQQPVRSSQDQDFQLPVQDCQSQEGQECEDYQSEAQDDQEKSYDDQEQESSQYQSC